MLFVVFINDLPEQLPNQSGLYLYADDTKIYRDIRSDEDSQKLQEDIYCMHEWSEKWLLKFHPEKCHTMSIGKNNNDRHYKLNQDLSDMEKTNNEKDVGVIIDDKLTFEKHITEKINKANSILGIICRSFEYLDKRTFKMLYVALVRPHLEYANAVWKPYKKKDITLLENVQRRGTKRVPGLSELPYNERLKALKLPTLAYRSLRGDMIEVFKIMKDMYYFDKDKLFTKRVSGTRGNDYKLFKNRSRLELRKHYFTNRVVDYWNALPNKVIEAPSVASFERRFDKYYEETDLVYNYEAQITTGRKIEDNNEELESQAVAFFQNDLR